MILTQGALARFLTQVKEREEKATKGPWEYLPPKAVGGKAVVPMTGPAVIADAWPIDEDNCDFIAHARTDIPKLLKLVEKLTLMIEKAEREGAHSLKDWGAELEKLLEEG